MKGMNLMAGLLLIFLLTCIPVNGKEYVIGEVKNPVQTGDPGAGYIGAEECKMCHSELYASWAKSGHKYKLNTPDEILAVRPDLELLDGYVWDDVLYVIGGWGWKARYINKSGYVITRYKNGTSHSMNQYNIEDDSWSSYNSGTNKFYDCQKCHNTGAFYDGGNHMGLPGMIGDWEFRGVQCEACHGPGSVHKNTALNMDADSEMKKESIIKDDSAAMCGQCHRRGDADDKIPASGGFTQHHEQYLDFLASGKMSGLRCVECHDPHLPVHMGATNPTEGTGIIKQCTDCHMERGEEFAGSKMAMAGVVCIDCHMPKAAKSAIIKGPYEGDVRSHLFKINTDPEAQRTYKDSEGKEWSNPYLTLGFTCLRCHADQDQAWATQNVEGIHTIGMEEEMPEPELIDEEPELIDEEPEPTDEEPKGACGPTAVAAIALVPLLASRIFRRH